MSKDKVIFVVGPTAAGKTDLGIAIAKRFGGEIVSADSMQIYKGIHIASAAPDESEMQGIKHHLLEFLPLDCRFSVADYAALARQKIDEIIANGNLPIVVGGTGLYISALLDHTQFASVKINPDLRKEITEEFDRVGAEEMLAKLAEFDPQSAAKLHPGDKRRIIRCFEIYRSTGKTRTEQEALSHLNPPDFEALVLGITYNDRQKLYERIDKRVDLMLQHGLLGEAKLTLADSDGKGAFQAIGHKELYGYLKGECTLEESVAILKQQTRRYAKRQLTWFRRDERIHWIYADDSVDPLSTAIKAAEEFL